MTQAIKRRGINNKGFSLVELIIVIGIMGILLVILVPQYTRYLENARIAKDETMSDSVRGVVETMLVDDRTFGGAFRNNDTITISTAGVVVVSTGDPVLIRKGLLELLNKPVNNTAATVGDTGDAANAAELALIQPTSNTYKSTTSAVSYVITIRSQTGVGGASYLISEITKNWK